MTLEVINTIGLFTSPVIAVVVTLIWQSSREKREQNHRRKEQLFMSMMAHRRLQPPSQVWVDSLNLIDVVFADCPEVLKLWHEYYDLLGSASYREESGKRSHKHLELLFAMAKEVGLEEIRQTDIDKFYSPIAHANEADLDWKLRTELLRVLQGAQNLVIPSTQGPSGPSIESGSETVQVGAADAPPNAGTPASGAVERPS